MIRSAGALLTLTILLGGSTALASEADLNHPGARIYDAQCADCHNSPGETRAPDLASLKEMTADALRLSLTQGVMAQQGKTLDRREMRSLIDYLARKASDGMEWLAAWQCDNPRIDLRAAPTIATVGVNHHSWRYLSAEEAGLSGTDLENLELAWAIGFPDTSSLRSSPVIIGNTMFYAPVQTERVIALDLTGPCVKWVYNAGIQLRSSITYGELSKDRFGLVFSDQTGHIHAVNPVDGSRLWLADPRHSEAATVTGAPLVFDGSVIVPISASGVGRGANPEYECCVEHGAVTSLDAETGDIRWTWHTMPDATYNGKTSRIGVKQRGPSGAPIWASPTIDPKRGVVYVASGQNTSLPATKTSDAIIAIDLKKGTERWVFQALANDVWIIGCRDNPERSTPNCPSPKDSVLKDFDFGAAPVLVEHEKGDVLLGGQKSGDVWGINPDDGSVIWNTRLGEGTPLGGVHWGMATDGTRVFAPINDPVSPFRKNSAEPGMNALDVRTGEILWRTPTRPDCENGRDERFEGCSRQFGLSAAPLAVDDKVIAGSLDGRLYVFDSNTGDVVWEFDTLRDFDTVNGVPAKGGSIESHSLFAGAGMIFVASGYGSFRQAPGNVLLAFKPKQP